MSDKGPNQLLPLLLDVAEGRMQVKGRKPSQACRSWVSSSGIGRPARLTVQRDGSVLAGTSDLPEVPEGMELIPLRVSGYSPRRVNLAFFGDGCQSSCSTNEILSKLTSLVYSPDTLDERDKFIADVRRLADEIVDDGTFQSTAPLFNFWAVFVPSAESGVGINGVPKKCVRTKICRLRRGG